MTSPSTKPTLPPMTRTVWASAEARKEWEPRIWRASSAWNRVERLRVPHGLRIAAQQWISIHDYLEFIPWAINNQVTFKVRRWTGAAGAFQHTSYPEGKDQVVVAFGRCHHDLLDKPEELFGYPPCCVANFEKSFPADVDPVLGWAGGALPFLVDGAMRRSFTPKYPWTSPLLRYLGVRSVPHIPCRHDCAASHKQAVQYLDLMDQTTGEGNAEDVQAILELPVTWDRYRGVVIITTPHFRVVATSSYFPHHEVLDVTV